MYKTKPCFTCQQPTKNKKYCSRSCSAKSTNRSHQKRHKLMHPCKKCSIPVRKKHRYCEKCRPIVTDYRTCTKTLGDFINEYKGKSRSGVFSAIRARARYHLQKNGELSKCQNCGYNKHVEACHIKAISKFPLTTPINIINKRSNLAVLCKNCHWEFDNGVLTL